MTPTIQRRCYEYSIKNKIYHNKVIIKVSCFEPNEL